jgi:hypothetical protein
MKKIWFASRVYLTLTTSALLLSFALLGPKSAMAQEPCDDHAPLPPALNACAPGIPLTPGTFSAVPLMDGSKQAYFDGNVVSLYGNFGNDEQHDPAAQGHYTWGTTLANQVRPLNPDGNPDDQNGKIIFLFIGFSNCSIEICGGDEDIWDDQDLHQTHLEGQPCANLCVNAPR